jgi:hypothetical protein
MAAAPTLANALEDLVNLSEDPGRDEAALTEAAARGRMILHKLRLAIAS